MLDLTSTRTAAHYILIKTLPLRSIMLSQDVTNDGDKPALSQLLQASQATLTTIGLGVSSSRDLSQSSLDTLLLHAHHIRHLVLTMVECRKLSPHFKRFFSALVNLQSITLVYALPQAIKPVLAMLPAPLVVLSIEKYDTSLCPAGGYAPSLLLQLLDLPALKKLKRWRIDAKSSPDVTMGEGKLWLAKCNARGIEVRDDRRFFNGESGQHDLLS